MRIAVSNIAWSPEHDEQVADVLLSAGVSAVEIAPTKAWADLREADTGDAESYRGHWSRLGMDIVSTQSLLFGRPDLVLFGDETQRRGFLEHLRHVLDLGAALGARAQVFGSPRNRLRGALSAHEAFAVAAEAMTELAVHAEARGTTLVVEANPAAYGADFLTSAHEAAALVSAVDRPGLRLHLDTACMQLAGDDAVQCVQRYAEILAHVHLSEPELGPVGVTARAMHGDVLAALRAVGYDKTVSVEMRPTGTPVASVQSAAVYAVSLLERSAA